jgi:signal transduction histidine kinase
VTTALLQIDLRSTDDLVRLRERARRVGTLSGLRAHDLVAFVAAVSEVARHAVRESNRASVRFDASVVHGTPLICAQIREPGAAARVLSEIIDGKPVRETEQTEGLLGARRLSDHFTVSSSAKEGVVSVGMRLPVAAATVTNKWRAAVAAELAGDGASTPVEELQRQNRELVDALDAVSRRTADVERLNAELAETNRGVLALYAELDEQAKSLKEVSIAKSRFVSDASHELRTPLNAIISLAGLLLDRVDGDLTAEQEVQVNFIRRSATSLVELVSGMLDLARIESGRIDVKVTTTSPSDLLSALRGMFRVMVPSRVTLLVDEPVGVPAFETDESKVAQILRNLVANALKFTERGQVRVRADVDNGHVRFFVSDTGIGLSPADLERIFEDFTQVDAPVQRRLRGTGLGLPLARRLARMLDGEVFVTSTPGEGSTFVLELPMNGPRVHRPPANDAEATAGDLDAR